MNKDKLVSAALAGAAFAVTVWTILVLFLPVP